MGREPPSVPGRTSSIDAPVTSDDDILYLAGRKPYEPQQSLQRGGSPSTSSLTSDGAVLPGSFVGKMLDGSTASLMASEDSSSLYSAASAHHPLAKRNSDGDVSNYRDVPGGDGEPIHRSASEKSRTGQINKSGLRHTSSLPTNPQVNITTEEDATRCGGLSNITEGEEMTGASTGNDQSRRSSLASHRSRDREMSPGALERPISPDQGASPGSSPRTSRKRRLASKRQTKRSLFGSGSSGIVMSDIG